MIIDITTMSVELPENATYDDYSDMVARLDMLVSDQLENAHDAPKPTPVVREMFLLTLPSGVSSLNRTIEWHRE